jgi:hypothetical protein
VQAEVDGERLTDAEIVSFFGLLIVAGNDTTRQSTSHGMKALTDFPDQRAWLVEDLDGRMAGAVEEIVRWATPIMTFRRTAARDCELGGQTITAGDKVIMFYASANWDTEVFDHPERFDLSRSPNPHVSFGGGGIHHCLGNQLARRQLAASSASCSPGCPTSRSSASRSTAPATSSTASTDDVRFTPEASTEDRPGREQVLLARHVRVGRARLLRGRRRRRAGRARQHPGDEHRRPARGGVRRLPDGRAHPGGLRWRAGSSWSGPRWRGCARSRRPG